MPRTSSRFISRSGQRPFERGLRDAVEVDRVVGDEAVAARDQLEAELALAEARLAGEQDAEAEDVHEDAVARRPLGEVLAEVAAHDVDHVAGRFLGDEERDVGAVAECDQAVGRHLPVGADQHRRLERDDARDAPLGDLGVGVVEVGDLAPADDLDPVRVDVIEDSRPGRRPSGASRTAASSKWRSGWAWPAIHSQCSAVRNSSNSASALMTVGFTGAARSRDRLQRLPGGDDPVHLGGVGLALEALAQLAVGQHLGDLGKDLEVALRRASGTSRKIRSETGSSSGASKAIDWRTRSTAASGFFSPLIRPCGMATPWPRPVEPSRSRANRLSVTVARAIACWFSNSRPACSNARFLLVASTSTRTSTTGRMAARRFMTGAPGAAGDPRRREVTKG
jgi:hypothetical protein